MLSSYVKDFFLNSSSHTRKHVNMQVTTSSVSMNAPYITRTNCAEYIHNMKVELER